MKNVILSAVSVFALSTAAFAYTDAPAAAVAEAEEELRLAGYDIPVEALTDRQIYAINAATMSESPSEKQAALKAILTRAQENYDASSSTYMDSTTTADADMVFPANSLRDAIAPVLAKRNYDVDVDTLTDEQVAAIYIAAFSESSEEDLRNKIDAQLNS